MRASLSRHPVAVKMLSGRKRHHLRLLDQEECRSDAAFSRLLWPRKPPRPSKPDSLGSCESFGVETVGNLKQALHFARSRFNPSLVITKSPFSRRNPARKCSV